MEQKDSYLIGELAERAGVTPRTIRYYVAEGLLPPPLTRGKYAHYDAEHLRRLQLIGRLKAEYLPLSVIRERLARAEDGGAALRPPAPRPGDPAERVALPAPRPGEGMRYGPAVGPTMAVRESLDPFRLTPATPQVGRVEFFPDNPELLAVAGDEAGQVTARWQRIVITPGVELHVREPLSDRRRRAIEAMVAAMRDALLQDEDT